MASASVGQASGQLNIEKIVAEDDISQEAG
jgi:hypothetical protein